MFYRLMILGVLVYMIGPVWGTGRHEQIYINGELFFNSQYVNGNFIFNSSLANLNGLGKKEIIRGYLQGFCYFALLFLW